MRTYTVIDIYLLMFLGLVFNILGPIKAIEPDFLLAAFAVIVVPKHHWKVPVIVGSILLFFTVVHNWFSLLALLKVVLSAGSIYCVAWILRKRITRQGIWTGIISFIGAFIGGWVCSFFSGEPFQNVVYWALLMTLLAYTFYVCLDFSERVLTAQYRKGQSE